MQNKAGKAFGQADEEEEEWPDEVGWTGRAQNTHFSLSLNASVMMWPND